MDGNAEVIGAYAWAHEMSSGKDTPSGHWEIAGVPVLFEWGYFSDHENSFPQELLDKLVERANLPGYSVLPLFRYGHSGSAGRRAR